MDDAYSDLESLESEDEFYVKPTDPYRFDPDVTDSEDDEREENTSQTPPSDSGSNHFDIERLGHNEW